MRMRICFFDQPGPSNGGKVVETAGPVKFKTCGTPTLSLDFRQLYNDPSDSYYPTDTTEQFNRH
jgi:hypothetical protein